MSLFLLTFFLLYGGVHYYAYRKIAAAVALTLPMTICLAAFMAAMIMAPVLVRISEQEGWEGTGLVLSHAGYAWMGLMFLFFCAAGTLDLSRFLVRLASYLSGKDLSRFLVTDRHLFAAAAVYAVAVAVYGYFEARSIHVERLTVTSPKIPPGMGPLTLVQVSDVHLGLIVRTGRLERMARLIDAEHPDILVSTGDLVDSQIDGLGDMARILREIRPRYGKFAVTGNHEYFAGIGRALEYTRQAGFTVLEGEARDVAGIRIAGVDDPMAGRIGVGKGPDEESLLSGLPAGTFTLFLKHRPAVAPGSLGKFDLQLSGHVHKGQIFPFELVTRLFYPVPTGFTRLPGGGSLYVSRGTGTWGPPIRFVAPPEITVIRLVGSGTAVSGQPAGIGGQR